MGCCHNEPVVNRVERLVKDLMMGCFDRPSLAGSPVCELNMKRHFSFPNPEPEAGLYKT